MADEKVIRGYFVYVANLRGELSPEKYGVERVGMPLSKKLDERNACTPIPLSDDEYKLSLAELVAKYPPPERVAT